MSAKPTDNKQLHQEGPAVRRCILKLGATPAAVAAAMALLSLLCCCCFCVRFMQGSVSSWLKPISYDVHQANTDKRYQHRTSVEQHQEGLAVRRYTRRLGGTTDATVAALLRLLPLYFFCFSCVASFEELFGCIPHNWRPSYYRGTYFVDETATTITAVRRPQNTQVDDM